jgi:predicted TIM-barrel fold metal-dependent hydrolase
MQTQKILSADSHVWEPPDLWQKRIDRRYVDRAPRLESAPEGDRYVCEGAVLTPLGSTQRRDAEGAGRAAEASARFAEVIRPGAYDPVARLADLERDGVQGEVIYPTVTLEMFGSPDTGLRQAVFRAYNNWIAEFCAARPGIYKALAVIDTDDVGAAVAELERCAKLGMVGALVSISPGDNRYVRPGFDRFWAAAESLGMPISLHSGTDMKPVPFMQKTTGMLSSMFSIVQVTLVDLVYGGVFARHPGLMVLSVENGAGWVPYMLQAMDVRVFLDESRKLRFGTEEPRRPSDYIRSNVRVTFMSDKLAMRMRDSAGVDTLMWASDYPHGESTFPHSQEIIARQLAGIPGDDRERMLYGNTARMYGFA